MVTTAAALKRLQASAAKLEDLTARQQAAMRSRDDALRAARDAGATYVEMQEAAGLSPVTVAKALKRK